MIYFINNFLFVTFHLFAIFFFFLFIHSFRFFYFFHFLFLALDSVVYPAMKAFPKGTEVTMCYGARPNDLLFVYSGEGEGNVK
jgi:hypothetical protein